MNRGNSEQTVFQHIHDYLGILELVLYAKERYSVELFAFCLMPDHFHLLVRPLKGSNLSHCMQWLHGAGQITQATLWLDSKKNAAHAGHHALFTV